MIALLTGTIAAREDGRCVIDVQGVGYLVAASAPTLAALPESPGIARLHTEMQVREDAITLYGFAAAEERDWFRLLTTVQGVGGRVALAILSILPPRALAAAIAGADRASLARAAGVGPKLAARLVTELRDRAVGLPTGPEPAFSAHPAGPGADAAGGGESGTQAGTTPAGDAVSALAHLGYRRAEAEAAVGRAGAHLGEGATLDTLIRQALRELAR